MWRNRVKWQYINTKCCFKNLEIDALANLLPTNVETNILTIFTHHHYWGQSWFKRSTSTKMMTLTNQRHQANTKASSVIKST